MHFYTLEFVLHWSIGSEYWIASGKVSRWIWYFYQFTVIFLMLWDILFEFDIIYMYFLYKYFFIHIIYECIEIFISHSMCKWYIKWWIQCVIITLFNFLNRVIIIWYLIFQLNYNTFSWLYLIETIFKLYSYLMPRLVLELFISYRLD